MVKKSEKRPEITLENLQKVLKDQGIKQPKAKQMITMSKDGKKGTFRF